MNTSTDISPDLRPWITQVVVETDPDTDGHFTVTLPAWQCDNSVTMDINDVPLALRNRIRTGFRCFVRANIGTDDPDALRITGWEV